MEGEVGAQWGRGVALLFIQTGVMRAVAMIMEKKAHPKNPWSSLPQGAQGSVERALHVESHPLLPWSLSLPLGSNHTSPPQRGCPRPSYQSGCLSFSPSHPWDFLYCNLMICGFTVYSFVHMFIVRSVRTVTWTVPSTVNPSLWAQGLAHSRCF